MFRCFRFLAYLGTTAPAARTDLLRTDPTRRIVKAGGECLTFDTLAMRPAAQEGGPNMGSVWRSFLRSFRSWAGHHG